MKKTMLLLLAITVFLFGCQPNESEQPSALTTYTILSLGDSYTIGESVCENCKFPKQLRDSLTLYFNPEDRFNLDIIAQTGWTTTDLKNAIENTDLDTNYNLVTLLIGVNNQFQNLPFETFENEFTELINTSIALAEGKKSNVIVISVFDYANTVFGQIFGGSSITEEITVYNNFIESYCSINDLKYIDAQNLIFNAIANPELIASDGLHPSELAYSNLVTQLLPVANEILIE